MLTCKEASRLLSQSQDQPLSRLRRMELRLHVWLCHGCANFEKHLKFLRQATRRLEGDDPLKDRVRLDDAARERIRKALRR